MADISKIKLPNNGVYNLKDDYAYRKGPGLIHRYSSIDQAPQHLSLFTNKMTGEYMQTIRTIAGVGDYFYALHLNPDYTVTSNYSGKNGTKGNFAISTLFSPNPASTVLLDVDALAETPFVLTINKKNGVITATDVVNLEFFSHTLGDNGAKLTDYKIQLFTTGTTSPTGTFSWQTVYERKGASDLINGLVLALNATSYPYLYFSGVRLTISGAISTSTSPTAWNYNCIDISLFRLTDQRPAFSAARAVGALDIAGGSVYGATTFTSNVAIQGALTASGASLTNLNGSNISSGTVAEARIAALPASKITSGTFDAARIPNLDAGKITSGTMAAARLPNASTAGKGIVQLNDTLDSNSVTQAATANAVKEVYNLAKKSQVIKKVENTNIIHIEDAAEKPLKECKIDIEPVQDLHGYDHPWPAGGGKNLAPVNNWSGHSGVISDMNLNIPANTQFTLSLFGTVDTGSNQYALVFIFSDDTESGWVNLVPSATRMSATRTYEKDVVGLRYYSHNGGWSASASITLTVEDFQIELGSTATSYAPYSNICPITGWTGAKVTRTGKNLFDEATATKYFRYFKDTGSNNHAWVSESDSGSYAFYCKQNTTYTVSCDNSAISIFRVGYIDVDPDGLATSDSPPISGVVKKSASGSTTITTGANAKALLIQCNSTVVTTRATRAQIELGSTTTNYEPYAGQTYDITFPSEAGTVYGGSLDVTNGVLTVDTMCYRFTGSESVYVATSNNRIAIKTAYNFMATNEGLCTDFQFVGTASSNFIYLGTSLTAEEMKIYMATHEVYAVCKIANPISYQLTPQEIITLLGTNNIWADTGNISCTYYVESELNTELNNYIPKSIGTAKGDIIYYSDNNTPNRLGIGNEGQVLKVNSSGIPAWDTDNSNSNTTYTFTGGTNQFTATSSDGATQTVNVTPQVPNASTSSAGIVQLSTATNSTSTTQAATPSAVKSAYDLAASKTSNTGTVTSVTLTAGNGISITDNSVPITTIGGRTITNTGVTSVSQGTTNGTINVTTNGSTSAVAIRGLGSAAYTASTAYATAAQGGKADAAMPKSGGTFTGAVTLHSDPTTNLMAATKQYVDNNVSISDNISSGTKIATITINGVNTDLYSPGTPQTISVTQSSSTPTLEFITSTNSSNSSTLTGVTTTALANGKMIVYRLAYALTGSPVTLTLSNTSGTSLGNYPVYIDGTTQCSDIYRAGTMLFLVFYNNKFTIVNPFGLAG